MREYHKIHTIFKRDEKTHKIVEGQYSLPEFEYLKDNKWVFTEKVDGTNIRIQWDGIGVYFGGKTDNAQIPTPLITRLQELFLGIPKREIFESAFGSPAKVCLYGEGYGAKIQKGGGNYNSKGVDLVLFDVKVDDWWLEPHNVMDVASKFNLRTVPLLGEGTLSDAVEMTRKGFNSMWGPFKAEGLVLRPSFELKTRRGDRIIAKIKCRDFQ